MHAVLQTLSRSLLCRTVCALCLLLGLCAPAQSATTTRDGVNRSSLLLRPQRLAMGLCVDAWKRITPCLAPLSLVNVAYTDQPLSAQPPARPLRSLLRLTSAPCSQGPRRLSNLTGENIWETLSNLSDMQLGLGSRSSLGFEMDDDLQVSEVMLSYNNCW